jgi:hypothetical protein
MSIQELVTAISPPKTPIEVGDDTAWASVQQLLGIALPTDYKDFGMHYGTGSVNDPDRLHIDILNPFSKEYIEKVSYHCKLLRKYAAGASDPYLIYPARPGLLPWGWDDNGNGLYWLTEGPAESWPIILCNEPGEYQKIELSMTSFLAKAFTRQLTCILWPDPVFFAGPEKVVFEPTQ